MPLLKSLKCCTGLTDVFSPSLKKHNSVAGVKVPADTWFRVELEFGLGKDCSEEGFLVSVTLPDETVPRVFPKNPMHRRFRKARWLGFVSLAKGGVRYWIDDFKLTP